MSHSYALAVAIIRDQVGVLEAREPMPGTERIELWQDVRDAYAELGVILRDLETDATDALVELLRDSGEDELSTELGTVHIGLTTPSERWQGWRLAGALARNVAPTKVDEDGVFVADPEDEVFRAVPLDVFRDVVAGCASDDLTSSKWRKTALRNHVADVRRYYDRDDPQPIIRAGAKRR